MAHASGRQPDSSHWSADGQLAGAENAHGEVTFAYDEAGRPSGERQRHTDSGWSWQHRHTLTATGAPQASRFGDLPELSWLTYGSGHLHGLLASELGLEIALEPDALHRETRRRLHSADHAQPLILERGYTALGQIAQLSLSSTGGAQGEQHYQYDALGRMTFRTQQGHGQASTIAYTYDPAGRLTASQHGDHAHRYPMDAAGNRLEAQAGNPPAPNSSNRLSQLDGNRYRHDGAGNLIERETPNGERLTLGYDGANRLVRLTHTSAYGHTREAHYRYDALGRRIAKTVRQANGTTATHHYGWDGDRLVHEATEYQRTTVVYEPGSFVPMLRVDQAGDGAAKQIGAYLTDALGTPLRLVTPQGETLWHADPDDWAAVTHEQGSTPQPIRFQGQWHDEESGLYYNRHRYYDPQQGRYISQDPIGLNGGTNLYGYVTNPTGMVDPLGLSGMGLSNLGAAYGPAAREAHAASMPPRVSRPTGADEEHMFWQAIKNVPSMFGQYVSERQAATAQSMCSGLGTLGNNEAMLSITGGNGLAAELALKASSNGISTISGIGAGGGAAIVASVGQSINFGAPHDRKSTDWRGFTSVSAGAGVWGGDTSLSAGTDGVTGSMRGGYGFGAAVVSGVQAESYILDCGK